MHPTPPCATLGAMSNTADYTTVSLADARMWSRVSVSPPAEQWARVVRQATAMQRKGKRPQIRWYRGQRIEVVEAPARKRTRTRIKL